MNADSVSRNVVSFVSFSQPESFSFPIPPVPFPKFVTSKKKSGVKAAFVYELFKWMCGGGGSLYKNAASESRLTRRICPIHFRDHGIEETITTQNENGIIMTMGDREKAKFMAFSSHRPSGEQQIDGNKHCEKQKGENFKWNPPTPFRAFGTQEK